MKYRNFMLSEINDFQFKKLGIIMKIKHMRLESNRIYVRKPLNIHKQFVIICQRFLLLHFITKKKYYVKIKNEKERKEKEFL